VLDLPETRYAITRDGVHIAYQTAGEGAPDIAYVGGYATHVEVELELSWAARYNRNLASIGRLIRFDKRGSGLSERASPLSDLETRTDDVRAVLDAVGSERVVLIGEGEGGALASFFAATYPDRTIGLVWIGPYARTAWAPDYPWGWPSEEEARAVELIRTTWGTHAYAKELLRGDISSVADDEEWVAWAARYFRYSMSPGEAVRFEQMWYETDARAILPAVSVPTLLICPVLSHDPGEDSDVVQQGRDVADRIVGSRLVILPPGDWAPISPGRQDQVVEEVRAFVDELATEQLALDTACSRPCSSPTSSTRRAGRRSWATEPGATWWSGITRSSARSSAATAASRWTRRATASSPRSTGRPGRCAALDRSSTRFGRSGYRYGRASTQGRSRRSPARPGGSRS